MEVKVDLGYDESLFMPNHVKFFSDNKPLFCYYFDSLLTTVREFRTIKCCEFYATSKIILNPKVALAKIQSKEVTDGASTNINTAMNGFIKCHRSHFNASQGAARLRVA